METPVVVQKPAPKKLEAPMSQEDQWAALMPQAPDAKPPISDLVSVTSQQKLGIDARLKSNAAIMTDLKSKVMMVESILIKKESPTCDKNCLAKVDAEADKMIKELKNPLHEVTFNCKDNFDTYTSEYDPDHQHVDRMTMEVMDV